MTTPDYELGGEKIDAALLEAWQHLENDIDVRISAIAEQLQLDRNKVLALSLLFFSTQLRLTLENKMVIVCSKDATAYPDPLSALFSESGDERYMAIYDQLTQNMDDLL